MLGTEDSQMVPTQENMVGDQPVQTNYFVHIFSHLILLKTGYISYAEVVAIIGLRQFLEIH